jgi:murein DD-endopeptidase MepM/ murein hydrolase activator NlpD
VGDGVRSVSTGRVVWVGPYRGFGRVVFVESTGGFVYVYAGNDRILVEVGDRVRQGMEIGRLGKSAHLGGARLIFMVYHNGRPIDPAGGLSPRLLRRPIRLP